MKRKSIKLLLGFSFFLFGSGLTRAESARSIKVPAWPPLKPLNVFGLKEVLNKSKGQVLILNLWATWCSPCREEFPELLRLYENRRHEGLRLVFLSVDEIGQGERVREFLRGKKINFLSYIRGEGKTEDLINVIDPEWFGAVPTTFVFDRLGKRVKTLFGAQTYAQLGKAIQPYL